MSNIKIDPKKKELETQRREIIFGPPDKFNRLWEREDLECIALRDYEYIDLYLTSGETMVCRLLEWGKYIIYVEFISKDKKIKALIHKHSIKMVIPKESNNIKSRNK